MHGFLKDIRFGVRSCARSPTFTLTIVLLLSLAIGVNVTVFAVVNAVLFKPLPIRDGDRLLRVYGHRFRAVPYANYVTYRDANATLSDLALSRRVPVRLEAEGLDVVADLAAVSGNYFHTLGFRPRWDAQSSPLTTSVAHQGRSCSRTDCGGDILAPIRTR